MTGKEKEKQDHRQNCLSGWFCRCLLSNMAAAKQQPDQAVCLSEVNFKKMKNKKIKTKYMKNYHDNFIIVDGWSWKEKPENS